MKRTLFSLLSILALALAGSVFAQSDYGSTDRPGDNPPPSRAVESGTQSGSPTGNSMYDTDGAPSQTEGSSPVPSSAAQAPTHESLPATASHLPLAFAIGVSALGAAAALRAYRLRSS
jgi:hypothetical protein